MGLFRKRRGDILRFRRLVFWARVFTVLGLAVHLFGFLVIPISKPPVERGDPPAAFVTYISLEEETFNKTAREKALLFDSEPLFLPTPFNYSHPLESPPALGREAPLFPAFPLDEIIEVDADNFLPNRLTAGEGQKEPRYLLRQEAWDYFSAFGQNETESQPLPPSPITLTARDPQTGSVVATKELTGESLSVSLLEQWQERPVFMLHKQSGFLLGPPFIQSTSGSGEVDQALLRMLSDSAFIFALPDGYFEVEVGR